MLTTGVKENRRKCVKQEYPIFDKLSESIITDMKNDANDPNDDLNAAICEDEVIEPTQFSPNKCIKILNEQNKENHEDKTINIESTSLVTKERSPTVLSKRSIKKETCKKEHRFLHRLDFNDALLSHQALLNETPKWHSKAPAKNSTPGRMLDSRSTFL